MVNTKLGELQHHLKSLATKYQGLDLPRDRHDLLQLQEPLRTDVEDALAALKHEFPNIPTHYVLPGIAFGFVDEITVLLWLDYLLIRKKLSPDQAIEQLRAFYSTTAVDGDVYVFFHGLDAIEFGDNAEYGEFFVGTAMKNGAVDGRFVSPRKPYTFSAQDFFIRTRRSLPICFQPAASFDLLREPHIVGAAILGPLSSKLLLLEMQLRAPVQAFSYHIGFDPSATPLALSFDEISTIVGAERLPGRGAPPRLTRDVLVNLWQQYDAVSPEVRDRLDVPLRWVSKSLHTDDPTDAMIAIGIAFEALFLDKHLTEQATYRLQLNGSLWLEDALEGRRAVRKDLVETYRARSKSVHGSHAKIDPKLVLRGRELARKGIVLALQRNFLPTDWTDWIVECFPPHTL